MALKQAPPNSIITNGQLWALRFESREAVAADRRPAIRLPVAGGATGRVMGEISFGPRGIKRSLQVATH